MYVDGLEAGGEPTAPALSEHSGEIELILLYAVALR